MADFGILGPFDDGRPAGSAPLSGRQRLLLAVLLVNDGRPVPVTRLADVVWSDPPESAKAQLHNAISAVRNACPAGLIVTRPAGYELDLTGHRLDLVEFRQGVEAAATSGDDRHAVAALTTALRLWRGTALADVPGDWAEGLRQVLQEEKAAAVQARLEVMVRLGDFDAIVREVVDAISENPFRERLHEIRLLALAAVGRKVEALEAYRELSRQFAEELGIGPGRALRDLELRILQDEVPVPLRAPARRPRQLPPRTARLTGREVLLAGVVRSLSSSEDSPPVVVLVGAGGIGKTAVAVAAGHELSRRFPDGQVFVDLRGAHADHADPHAVTGTVLRALGVDGTELPSDRAERTALYRSRLADLAVLLVLDDAASEQQVRPLLPGTGRCASVVTSRRQLGALLDSDRYPVPLLAEADAVALLARIAGPERIAAEPEAARELVRLCGHLPLAVCIAAARLTLTEDAGLGEFRARLADERSRLDELVVGDLDVRASISLGYRPLPADARQLLRVLGLVTAPDWPRWVADELLGRPSAEEFDLLVEAHLVEPAGQDGLGQHRYRLHDLVADFARERALAEDGAEACDRATTRMVSGWLALASAADELVPHGTTYAAELGAPPPPPSGPDLDADMAAEWFEIERLGLEAAVGTALNLDATDLAGHLVLCLSGFYTVHSYDLQREELLRRVTDHVRGDDRLLLRLLPAFYESCSQLDLLTELPGIAAEHLKLARHFDDAEAEAMALWQAGRAERLAGRLDAAMGWLDQAVRCARASEVDPALLASCLGGLANALVDLGRPSSAVPHTAEAVALGRDAGPTRELALKLHSHGTALVESGQLVEAEAAASEMFDVTTAIGDDVGVAFAQVVLAQVAVQRRDWGAAERYVEASERAGEELHYDYLLATAVRQRFDLLAARGRWREAAEVALGSLRTWRSLDSAVEAARTLARLHIAHDAMGDAAAATRYREETEQALAELGLRPESLRLPPHLVVRDL
ncbi:BTAD domain-containing putative transcriptional regulator [Lentzea sp. JNUCC 0626]|uniref:AfsR/SARP family transcriptional regulator n=1 Tax=Lentzea sp. JNUCC 0626 TaxID=3367513 RepID=UPI00374A5012